MAISLDGTTQSVRVGAAATATDVYRTRPFTIAVLINADNTTNNTIRYLYSQDLTNSWGFGLEDTGNLLTFFRGGLQYSATSTAIAAGTGWWLVGCTMRDGAFNSPHDFFAYRYNTRTLSIEAGPTASVDSDPSAPGAGQETHIGQDKRSGTGFYGGEVGWCGIWNYDLTNAGSSTAPDLWTLIVEGPWPLVSSTCELFVPMLRSNLIDHSKNGRSLGNVGGAGFVGGHATELPPGGVVVITQDAPAGGTTVTPGTASLSLSSFAPTVSVSNNQTVTPGTRALTLSTFAPTVTASDHQVVTPSTRALSLSTFAPTVSVSDNQTVTPGTLALSLSTFAPTVTTTANQTVTPGTASLTLSAFAPTVTTTGNITVTPDVRALTLSTFAPTVTASGSVTVTPGVLALTLTAFAPTVTASDHQLVTPGTRALTLSTFAPTVTVASASGNNNLQPYIVVYFWRRDA